MTREEVERAAEVMLAYANGKKIQYFNKMICRWIDAPNNKPKWDWFNENYRIAPDQEEPKDFTKMINPNL